MTDQDTEERAAYQRAVERAKDEIARLQSDVFGLRTALEQQDRALEAERAARQIAEADNAELIRLASVAVECVRGLCYSDGTDAAIKRADRWMPGFMQHIAAPRPGAALLAELEAARAVVAACEIERRLMPFRVRAAMEDYDRATKARTG